MECSCKPIAARPDTALLNVNSLTWTPTGKNKFDVNDEEGWTLLPNKKVLTVDAYVFAYDAKGTNSEIYNPASGTWSSAGSTGCAALGLRRRVWRVGTMLRSK